MQAKTSSVKDAGSSILLMLEPSLEMLTEQVRIVSAVASQLPIRDLHVTLMRSAKNGKPPLHPDTPPPPASIEFEHDARLVSHAGRISVYLRATPASQRELEHYIALLAGPAGVMKIDQARVFHVSLTNTSGLPGESVARIWEYGSIAI